MFTGIIQHIGEVVAVEPSAHGVRITLDLHDWEHTPGAGESIANNGCCLTVVGEPGTPPGLLVFDAIPETLSKTTLGDWEPGARVNLERALRMGDTLDGHQVQGHVDGTGEVLAIDQSDGWRLRVGLGADLMRFMVPKGSIAIDGISLTIADLSTQEGWVEVALIPETLQRTNLGERAVGDRVNIEADVMVKTIVHTLERMNALRP